MFMSPSVRRFSWSLSINLNIVWSIAISALPIYYPLVFQHFNYSVSCYVFPFLRIFKTCYISKSFPSHRFYSRILYIFLWPLYSIISQIFGTSGGVVVGYYGRLIFMTIFYLSAVVFIFEFLSGHFSSFCNFSHFNLALRFPLFSTTGY